MKGKIFNAQEVQAIISGNKTQFREVIKPYPVLSDDKSYWEFEGVRWAGEKSSYAKNFGDNARPEIPDLCPYQVGQKIFCKENFATSLESFPIKDVKYSADQQKLYGFLAIEDWKNQPAQHMKQEQSRLTLQIKEIRVERLQSISCADYFAETGRRPSITHADLDCGTPDPRNDFKDYWNATHKKPEEKFEANPWVWVVSCEVVK